MRIDQIKEQPKGKCLVFIEGIGSILLSEKERNRYGIEEGFELNQKIYEEIKENILLPNAKKRALFCLQRMFLTERKMREKLVEMYPQDVVEEVILFLYKFKYLDDQRYAMHFIRLHLERKSKRELQVQLFQRGISKEIFEESFASCLSERKEEGFEEYSAEQLAVQHWIRKKQKNKGETSQKEKEKLIQTLLRKGFSFDEIQKAWNICYNAES